jgi:hypothetical protein
MKSEPKSKGKATLAAASCQAYVATPYSWLLHSPIFELTVGANDKNKR